MSEDFVDQFDYHNFSNHFTTDEVCWLVSDWVYICECVCYLSEEKYFVFKFLKIEMICYTEFEIWGRVFDLLLSSIGQKRGGKFML